MNEINDQLDLLTDSKENIRKAIITKGVEVSEDDPLSSYAEKITDIPVETSSMGVEDYDTGAWHVRKYSDGYCELTMIKSVDVTYNSGTKWGDMYCVEIGSFALPFKLIKKYGEQATLHATAGNGWIGCKQTTSVASLTSTGAYTGCRPSGSGTGNFNHTICIYITGRWK